MKVSGKTTKAIAMAGIMAGAPLAATVASTAPAAADDHGRVCGQKNRGVQMCLTVLGGNTRVETFTDFGFAVPGHFEFAYMDGGQWRHWRNFGENIQNGWTYEFLTNGTQFANAPEQLVTFWKDNGGQTGFICNVWN